MDPSDILKFLDICSVELMGFIGSHGKHEVERVYK